MESIEENKKQSFKEKTINFFKEIAGYLAIIAAVILIRMYVVTPIAVKGTSMYPNLANGQILILKKYDKSIKRFDIVVFKYQGQKLIKRVIGLPGETVEYNDSKLYINGELVEEKMINVTTNDYKYNGVIPEGYYFVMGDNRPVSKDSRIIGLVKKSDIVGTTDLSLFPFNRFGFVK